MRVRRLKKYSSAHLKFEFENMRNGKVLVLFCRFSSGLELYTRSCFYKKFLQKKKISGKAVSLKWESGAIILCFIYLEVKGKIKLQVFIQIKSQFIYSIFYFCSMKVLEKLLAFYI